MTKHRDTRNIIAATLGCTVVAAAAGGYFLADAREDGWVGALIDVAVILSCVVFALVMRRADNEVATLLIASPKDERQAGISRGAGNVTGTVAGVASTLGYTICSLTGAHAEARGFGLMMSICGGTFIVATAVLSRRS